MARTMNVEQAIEAQKKYVKSLSQYNKGDWTHEMFSRGEGFAPMNGVCFCCGKQIYQDYGQSHGISVETAGRELTIGCPHCNRSYVD